MPIHRCTNIDSRFCSSLKMTFDTLHTMLMWQHVDHVEVIIKDLSVSGARVQITLSFWVSDAVYFSKSSRILPAVFASFACNLMEATQGSHWWALSWREWGCGLGGANGNRLFSSAQFVDGVSDEKRTIDAPKGWHLEHPKGLRDAKCICQTDSCRRLIDRSVYVVRSLQMSTLWLRRHQLRGLENAHWQEKNCQLKSTRLNYSKSNPCFCVGIIVVCGSFIFVVATIGMCTEVSSHKSSSGCSGGGSHRYEEALRWRCSPKRHKHAFFGWKNWKQSGQKLSLVCRNWCICNNAGTYSLHSPSQWIPSDLATLIGLISFRMHGLFS